MIDIERRQDRQIPVATSTEHQRSSQVMSSVLSLDLLTATRMMATAMMSSVMENRMSRTSFLRRGILMGQIIRIGIERTISLAMFDMVSICDDKFRMLGGGYILRRSETRSQTH